MSNENILRGTPVRHSIFECEAQSRICYSSKKLPWRAAARAGGIYFVEEQTEKQGGMGFYVAVALVAAALIAFAVFRTGGAPEKVENKFAQLEQKRDLARKLIEDLKTPEALDILNKLEAEAKDSKETGADRFLPIVNEYRGICYFDSGDVAKALEPFQNAVTLSEKVGDPSGVLNNLRNLYELYRYMGDAEKASAMAEKLSAEYTKAGKAVVGKRYQKLASVVKAGEPLLRIVVLADGGRLELDELANLKGKKIQFEVERNRPSLRPSQVLKAKGDRLGANGKYEEALDAFKAAAKADPFNPAPHYQEALTYLYMHRYADAEKSYDETEKLAPGWYNCRSEKWMAEKLADGSMSHETFMAIKALETGQVPAKDKEELAKKQLEAQPNCALLELSLGKQLSVLGKTEAAEAALRQGILHAEESDVRTRLLVQLGMVVKSSEERERLLNQAIKLNGNIQSVAMAAVSLAIPKDKEAPAPPAPNDKPATETPPKGAGN